MTDSQLNILFLNYFWISISLLLISEKININQIAIKQQNVKIFSIVEIICLIKTKFGTSNA